MVDTWERESSLETLTDDFGITEEDTCHNSKQAKRSKYLNGPDQVVPADSEVTTKNDVAVKLRVGESGLEALEPISVPGLLQKVSNEHPNKTAIVYKNEKGSKVKVTYKEYQELVYTCAKAFLKLGLKRYHSVGILGFNSVEWVVSYLAAIYAGGHAVGIYTSNSAEECHHCLENSGANIVVVEDDKQLEKVVQVKGRLPQLKAIIQYRGKPTVIGVYSWEEVMNIGKEESDTELKNVLRTIAVNECCSLLYTPGTTEFSKAAMMSHDNVTWSARVLIHHIGLNLDHHEEIVSYLPLSHALTQITDIYVIIMLAGSVYFADKAARKGLLFKMLHEVRPTMFTGVPILWEKIYEKLVEVDNHSGAIKKMIDNWAKNCILKHNLNRLNGQDRFSVRYALASKLVFLTVKKALGFDRSRLFMSEGAPLSSEIRKYFLSLDVLIMNMYGLTEGFALNGCTKTKFILESSGKSLTGVYTKIRSNPNNKNEGEICCYGRNVFMGYLNDPIKTVEAIDETGWLHTGDLGRLDKDGFLFINGKRKEIIITAGGDSILPVHTEDLIKAELPHVSYAVLVGDKREFLSVLLTLKTHIDTDTGEPADQLTKPVREWCKSLGCDANTVTQLLQGQNEKVMSAIQEGINRANRKVISHVQQVQKFAILPKDFSLPTGELGSTMKIKRHVILEKYADIIKNLYENNVFNT